MKRKKVSVPLETFNLSLSKQIKLFLEKNNRVKGRRPGGYRFSVERQYVLCQNAVLFNKLYKLIECSLISTSQNL